MIDRGLSLGPTTAQPSPAGRSWPLAWMVGVLAVIQTTAGVGVALVRGYDSSNGPRNVGAVSAASSVPGPLSARSAVVSGALPLAVDVPSVGIATSLIRLHVAADGALEAPGSFGVAGWWAEGAEPGKVGPAVLVGHVDSKTGPAVFYRLDDVKPGAMVSVTRSDHSVVRFAVDRVRQFPKDRFPAEEVYGPTSTATLRLITCGGRFNRRRGEYDDNVVVFAHLVAADAPQKGSAPA